MDMQEIGMLAGLALVGFGLFLAAWRIALRQRKAAAARVQAPPSDASAPVPQPAAPPPASPHQAVAAGPDPLVRRLERRMEEIEAVQADLAERFAEIAEKGSPAKLQAMAGSLLTLVRNKNAAMETALAGLDGLRARLETLESVGDLAEARALVDGLKGRIEAIETAEARAAEARAAEIRGLEARLAAIGAAAEAREEVRRQAEAREIERRAAEGPGAVAELGEALARLHAQKEAAVEMVFARLGPLEAKLAAIEGWITGLDPAAALDRFAERLGAAQAALAGFTERVEAAEQAQAALAGRVGAIADPGGALAEIRTAVAGLREQRDAALDAVNARLAGLERALAEPGFRAATAAPAPQAAGAKPAELPDVWRNPRVVSLHQSGS